MKRKAAAFLCIIMLAFMMTSCNTESSGDQAGEVNKPSASPQITTGTSIPAGFPTDIPMVSDGKITSSVKRTDTDMVTYTVVYETKQKFQNVRTLYMDYLQNSGYQDVGNMGSEHSALLNGSLDGGKKNLTVSILDNEDRLQVTIQYIAPPQ